MRVCVRIGHTCVCTCTHACCARRGTCSTAADDRSHAAAVHHIMSPEAGSANEANSTVTPPRDHLRVYLLHKVGVPAGARAAVHAWPPPNVLQPYTLYSMAIPVPFRQICHAIDLFHTNEGAASAFWYGVRRQQMLQLHATHYFCFFSYMMMPRHLQCDVCVYMPACRLATAAACMMRWPGLGQSH